MAPSTYSPDISLLWPPRVDPRASDTSRTLSPASAADLDLDAISAALCDEREHARAIRGILTTLVQDPAVIHYRQEVLADLLAVPELAERFTALLPTMDALERFNFAASPGQTSLHEVVWRVGQLENYVDCVQGLSAVFDGVAGHVRSDGLRQLQLVAHNITQDATFQQLAAALPEIVAQVRSIASVTIGVNLDDELRPVGATLLAVNNQSFHGESATFLDMLFGRGAGREWEGIAPLHSVPDKSQGGPQGVDVTNPMMYPLFRDLAQVLRQTSRPVTQAIDQFKRTNTRFLGALRTELAFFLGAARLFERVRASGLPICRPAIAPAEERVCALAGTYNLPLALRTIASKEGTRASEQIVPNDIDFGPDGRIFVLTGPNQGGKTTFTQAVGLAHVLAQVGLYVPGTQARISPVDGIYTHFPVEERPESGTGRLGEEAQRLSEIFTAATAHSLVLLNESLASTSAGESLYLARDIVRILRRLGARAIYATHLHELAADVDDINAATPGDSRIVSLVSLISEDSTAGNGAPGSIRQTYRIVPGPPRGRSYAREIAARYGISYEQLADLLQRRGLLDAES